MKIIFLDIDGVLMSFEFMHSLAWKQKINGYHEDLTNDRHGHHFDPRCVLNLSNLVSETNAKIVISSSWRLAGLQRMKDLWSERSLPGEMIDITPKKFETRAEQINSWVSENNPENWIVIDDESVILEPIDRHRFIKVDGQNGFSFHDSRKALKILNKE